MFLNFESLKLSASLLSQVLFERINYKILNILSILGKSEENNGHNGTKGLKI